MGNDLNNAQEAIMGVERRQVLPGFTAGSSVQQRVGVYASRGRASAGREAVRAQLLWGRGPGGCIPGCICVTFENCPCCTSIFDTLSGRTGTNPSWS